MVVRGIGGGPPFDRCYLASATWPMTVSTAQMGDEHMRTFGVPERDQTLLWRIAYDLEMDDASRVG